MLATRRTARVCVCVCGHWPGCKRRAGGFRVGYGIFIYAIIEHDLIEVISGHIHVIVLQYMLVEWFLLLTVLNSFC